MEFVDRENEIFRMLHVLLEEQFDFVVVGGYAVSGLGKHRFSVDCDVVISKTELGKTKSVLRKQGYEREVERAGFDDTYAGKFARYKKKVGALPVTFDLLVGSLVCRTTGAAWSFDYILKHSAETTIGGIENMVNCRVPKKELMIAFKIHSARRTDVRDIIMMMENSDLEQVITHLRRGKTEVLITQIRSIIEMLDDVKLVDSLKGVFTLSVDVRKQILGTQKNMARLLKRLK